LNQVHGDHLGRKILSVSLLVNGREYGKIKMSGDVKLFGNVLCLRKRVPRDTILTEEDVQVMRRDIGNLNDTFFSEPEEIIGKQLKNTLNTGAILFSRHIQSPTVVKRGDLVSIVARSPSMLISVPGKSKNDGAKGDIVRVKNMMSRKIIFAEVINEGEVEVDF